MSSTTSATIPITRFDLSTISTHERYAIWKESISVIFQTELPEKTLSDSFDAKITTCHLSSVLLSCTTSQQQYFNRPAKLIANDGLDHFLIQLYTQGSTSGQWGKHNNSTVRAGDIFLLDLTRPITSLTENFSNLTLVVPRNMLTAQFPNIELLHGCVLPRESTLGRLLGEHILALQHGSLTMTAEEAGAVGQGVVNLAALYFNGTLRKEECPAMQVATQKTIRHYIIKNLTNPDLSPEMIAAHFQMSRAYLYRIFDSTEGVAHFIQEQRLLRAFNMLSHAANGKRRISEIAFSLGFSNDSHFSRSFYRYFGITASEVRKNALVNNTLNNVSHSIDRRYENWVLDLL